MAKILKEERLAIIFVLSKVGTEPTQVNCRADYVVSAEGLSEQRTLEISLTAAQKTMAQNFAQQVLANIKTAEGI